MAKEETEESRVELKKAEHKTARYNLREAMTVLSKAAAEEEIYSRHVPEDRFLSLYSEMRLLQPPYNFESLYTIYEESDILQSCVEAMQKNVDGFGYDMQFLGDDFEQKKTPLAKIELQKAKDFFDHANEDQSWMAVRKLMREDYEVLGCGALEVVRNRKGEIQMVYHIPFRYLRLAALDGRSVSVPSMIPRNGREIPIKVRKYFRKFCQISSTGKRLRWFKAFGDPRIMDATTGKFGAKPKLNASEILYFKNAVGGSIYGLPRWIGALLDVMGRRSASFVNYDLFESQGIPPMAVMVSNGVLSGESVLELEKIIRGLRGVERWNRIMLLESEAESFGLEDKGGAKIDLKNLAEYRKEDMMFHTYLKNTEQNTRHRFRLPPLYVGGTETFTLATAKASKTIAEEQVFVPERDEIDEIINSKVVQRELGIKLWEYKTRGPRITGSEELSKGVETFTKVGGFSVNHAIQMANQAFGMQMSKFPGIWADYPLPLVLKLLDAGMTVKGLEDLSEPPPVPAAPPGGGTRPGGPKQLRLPGGPKPTKKEVPYFPQKVLRSEGIFDDREKKLYKQLLLIQSAVESMPAEDFDFEDEWTPDA